MIDEYPKFLSAPNQVDEVVQTTQIDMSQTMTDWLWIFATWFIVTLNLFSFCVSIRDMYYQGYSPSVHWSSSAVLVATIGGIVAINNYIKK